MSVVPRSSDVFVQQKLASGSVHGCTLPDRLFSKGLWIFSLFHKQDKRIRQNRQESQNKETVRPFEPRSGEILVEQSLYFAGIYSKMSGAFILSPMNPPHHSSSIARASSCNEGTTQTSSCLRLSVR